MNCLKSETELNREIVILLTNTGTLFSRSIKRMTNEPYTHVSISFDHKLKELYSFGRKTPNNPFFAGFIREDVHNGLYGKCKGTTCSVYTMQVSDAQYQSMKKIIREFKKNRHAYNYNLLGFIGVLTNRPIERKYNYFCSQFVASVLDKSGIDLFEKPYGLVTPKDFRESPALKLIFSGMLSEYIIWQADQAKRHGRGNKLFQRFQPLGQI